MRRERRMPGPWPPARHTAEAKCETQVRKVLEQRQKQLRGIAYMARINTSEQSQWGSQQARWPPAQRVWPHGRTTDVGRGFTAPPESMGILARQAVCEGDSCMCAHARVILGPGSAPKQTGREGARAAASSLAGRSGQAAALMPG